MGESRQDGGLDRSVSSYSRRMEYPVEPCSRRFLEDHTFRNREYSNLTSGCFRRIPFFPQGVLTPTSVCVPEVGELNGSVNARPCVSCNFVPLGGEIRSLPKARLSSGRSVAGQSPCNECAALCTCPPSPALAGTSRYRSEARPNCNRINHFWPPDERHYRFSTLWRGKCFTSLY